MDKNLNEEYLKEKEYLDNVFIHLNNEINNYLNRRKEVSDVIVEYRRKFVEEYRDDDDKVIEYFDHENHKNEQIFNNIEKRIKEFLYLKKSPYFGKISICEDGVEEKFYIGVYGFDVGYDVPLIIDWRAPIASLFYQGKLGRVSYIIPSKEEIFVELLERRQFLIKNGKIISMFDSEIDVKDEFLKELSTLSEYLLKEKKNLLYDDVKMVKTGLTPTIENFSLLIFLEDNLQIIFPPYQVGPWSSGAISIKIPYLSIENYLKV